MAVLLLLLDRAQRDAACAAYRRYRDRDLRVAPACDCRRYASDGHAAGALRRAEPVVAQYRLRAERSRRSARSRVSIVRYLLITQSMDRQRFACRAHPRSNTVAVNFADRGCCIRICAVRVVVACACECRSRHHWRVHVLGLTRHERNFIAELAVLRVKQRIGNHLSVGRRAYSCIQDRTRVVHTRHHHCGPVSGRVRWVYFPRGVGQPVVGSPLVGIDA